MGRNHELQQLLISKNISLRSNYPILVTNEKSLHNITKMDYLYIVILVMTTTMLILLLILFGSMLATKRNDFPFPNRPNRCPDKWPEYKGSCLFVPAGLEGDLLGEIEKYNKLNPSQAITEILGRIEDTGNNNGTLTWEDIFTEETDQTTGSTDIKQKHSLLQFDPTTLGIKFSDHATLCDKKKWANFYGIQWDGVSNFNHCD